MFNFFNSNKKGLVITGVNAGKVATGNVFIGVGHGLNLAGDAAQKVADGLHAAGDACIKKGIELKGEEVKKEEKKQTAAPAKKKAEKKKAPVYTMNDVLGKHKNLANAATQLSKEYKNVVFESNCKNKGVLVFNAVRKSDGAAVKVFAQVSTGLIKVDGKTYGEVKEEAPVVEEVVPAEEAAEKTTEELKAELDSLLNSEPAIEEEVVEEVAQEVPAVEEAEDDEVDGMDALVAAYPNFINGIKLMQRKYGQLNWGGLKGEGRYAVIGNDLVILTLDLKDGTMAHKPIEAPVVEEGSAQDALQEKYIEQARQKSAQFDSHMNPLFEKYEGLKEAVAEFGNYETLEFIKVARGILFLFWLSETGEDAGEIRIRLRDLAYGAVYSYDDDPYTEEFVSAYSIKTREIAC